MNMTAIEYDLRSEHPQVNYKTSLQQSLPKLTGSRMLRRTDKLYPVQVVETDGTKVKIHCVGYSDKHDECREEDEVKSLDMSDC